MRRMKGQSGPQEWALTVLRVPLCTTTQLFPPPHRLCTGLRSLDRGPPQTRFANARFRRTPGRPEEKVLVFQRIEEASSGDLLPARDFPRGVLMPMSAAPQGGGRVAQVVVARLKYAAPAVDTKASVKHAILSQVFDAGVAAPSCLVRWPQSRSSSVTCPSRSRSRWAWSSPPVIKGVRCASSLLLGPVHFITFVVAESPAINRLACQART